VRESMRRASSSVCMWMVPVICTAFNVHLGESGNGFPPCLDNSLST
jgi:hypothetical protein